MTRSQIPEQHVFREREPMKAKVATTLLEFLVFQTMNFGQKNQIGWGAERPFIILDKLTLTCPM
jgi:hypothetical protein